MKNILLTVLFTLLGLPPAMGDRLYESCDLSGWTLKKAGERVHYSVHIRYHPPTMEDSETVPGGIKSLEVRYEKQVVTFPQEAFNDCSKWWGTPSHFGFSPYGGNARLGFFNCGDGAKSYSMFFSIRDGRLVERHLIPAQYSELNDQLKRFDRAGKVIYDGPCDRQGKPIR